MTYEELHGKSRTPDLIERGYLLFRINDDPLGYNMDDFDKLYGIILNAPSVDVVPREQYQRMVDTVARLNEYIGNIVRCKDCKHYYADPWGYGNCVFEGGVSRRTKDSDFCSWCERKETE